MKANEIKKSTIKRRLKKMYNFATPEGLKSSLNWYFEAHNFCKDMNKKYGVSVEKCAAVISALSPAVSWDTNKTDALYMIEIFVNFGELENCLFSTYTQNAFKAWQILKDYKVQSVEEIFEKYFNNGKSGFKTANFFVNIAQPENKNFVTIDRHQISICKNLKKSGGSQVATKKVYQILKEVHIETAKELQILPSQLQAVTWSTFRTEVLGYQQH
jgi:hypothetical protein